MMQPSRLGCPLSRKTPNMGNTGLIMPPSGRDRAAQRVGETARADTLLKPNSNRLAPRVVVWEVVPTGNLVAVSNTICGISTRT